MSLSNEEPVAMVMITNFRDLAHGNRMVKV